MAKKKTRRTKMSEEAEHPIPVQDAPKIEYNQPLSSPYELPVVTIIIGDKKYGIPEHYLRKCPQLNRQLSWDSIITLPGVYEDIGHTLVHFLYSDSYETINSALDQGTSCAAREYRRSILVYKAARLYDLPDLEILARKYIEQFSESLSVFDILRVTRDVFSKLPKDEIWLPSYIKRNLQQSFMSDRLIFKRDEIYSVLGEDHDFDKAVMRMIVDIYSDLQLLESKCEELPAKECPADTYHAKEPPAEAYSAEEWPACAVEEPPTEDRPAEELPTEDCPAEDCPAEDCPAEDCPAEDCPAEDRPAEDCPAEDCPAEDCPAEEPAAEEWHAYARPVPKRLVPDVSLYDNWKNLSSKKRAKRERTLKEKGLPIPDQDGVFPILVVEEWD